LLHPFVSFWTLEGSRVPESIAVWTLEAQSHRWMSIVRKRFKSLRGYLRYASLLPGLIYAGAWSGGVGILKDATVQCEDAQSRRQRDSKVAAVERGAGTRMDARPRRRPRPNLGRRRGYSAFAVASRLIYSPSGSLW
jgi:hypothetical protein